MSREGDLLRSIVLKMIWQAGSGHLGGSLSCAEIMSVLYDKLLQADPNNPRDAARDRFILSKGHAAPMLYACMARYGWILEEELGTLREFGTRLQGHPSMHMLPGVEMSTGSLGLGLSVGVGMALALKGKPQHVYVLLGDGEMQEGQNWEAFMSMRSFEIINLTPIIDANGVQLDGMIAEIQPGQSSLKEKLMGFGIRVYETNGHDEDALIDAFAKAKADCVPHAIIANTVKGKGVSFMEGKAAWHGKPLSEDEYMAAMSEIEGRLHL